MEPVRARCLVVDDDDWSREYILDLLRRLGVEGEFARDGLEAAALLDDNAYDLVFMDLDLPRLPGEAVLESLVSNRRRPGSIVVMSGMVERIEKISPIDWDRLGISNAIPKPMAAQQVKLALQRALDATKAPQAQAWSTGPGSVVIVGSGLWTEALSRVVTRGGGSLVICQDPKEALAKIAERKPPAVIAGPPVHGDDLVELFAAARASSPRSTLFAALDAADDEFRPTFQAIGVAKMFSIPKQLGELAVAIVTAATLNTRTHPRVPIAGGASVITHDRRVSAITRDVSEGGLCLDGIEARIARGPAQVEFSLPGAPGRVAASGQVVWVAGGGDTAFRAGVRFENVPEPARRLIRRFVEQQLV